jgi:formiminoglutamase
MSGSHLPNDPLWPRAGAWLTAADGDAEHADLALVGIPACRSSISPTRADTTPLAVREALQRYSTWGHDFDVSVLRAIDFGDVPDPDGPDGARRVGLAVATAKERSTLVVVIGGDNSITHAAMRGVAGEELPGWGLVTLDAHHDLRDGESNGSPVRRLLDDGLPGEHIVQIGIADFSNSAAYAARAREYGITVVSRSVLRDRPAERTAAEALAIAGAGGRPVYIDIDADVCDRAEMPGCPASAPGGLSADDLRHIVFHLANDPRVAVIDITEIDAAADAADGRTVRLAALLVLEIAAGLVARTGGARQKGP